MNLIITLYYYFKYAIRWEGWGGVQIKHLSPGAKYTEQIYWTNILNKYTGQIY